MLISPSYARLNAELHRTNPHYGTSSAKRAAAIRAEADRHDCRSVLDYGCGKGGLRAALGFSLDVREYDPAIEGKNEAPASADLVVCTDVLEHVEPECLDAVLDDLRGLALKAVFLVVSTVPSKKTLADGSNAHLIVEPLEWWLSRLNERWEMRRVHAEPVGFVYMGVPK